ERDSDELRARFRRLCSRCFHDVDLPPFLRKPCRLQSPLLLRATWQLGKLWPSARGLHEWYGRPQFHPREWVLIKQVNFSNAKLPRLSAMLAPKIVAIVRNPYASVDSAMRFNHGCPVRTPERIGDLADELRALESLDIPVTPGELQGISDAAY